MFKKYRKAFTLIELLVVIVIIGILAALIIVNVSKARKKARLADLQSTAKTLVTAAAQYGNDNETDTCATPTELGTAGLIDSAPFTGASSRYTVNGGGGCSGVNLTGGGIAFTVSSTALGSGCTIAVTNGTLGTPSAGCP